MAKIANHMTRIVAIGELDSYDMNEAGNMGKGKLKIKDATVQFVLFNNDKETATNPHTKATDFGKLYKKGDKVFITGSDSRNYSADRNSYFEGIQVWDYRRAEETEATRWVFVYVGDVKEVKDSSIVLSFINYKDEEMIFPINLEGAKADSFKAGDRIKVKGEIFSGMKMDFYGDGEFVTERNAVELNLLNTLEEIEEDAKAADENSDAGMWD